MHFSQPFPGVSSQQGACSLDSPRTPRRQNEPPKAREPANTSPSPATEPFPPRSPNRPPRPSALVWFPFHLVLLFLSAAAQLAFAAPAPSSPERFAPFYQPGKIRALILSGRNNHDWRTTTPFLRELLDGTGRFDSRVAEATDAFSAETLAPFDVLIMDYGGPRWSESTEQAIESFVQSGKGFVSVHGACYHFSGLDVVTDGHRPVGWKEPAWAGFRRMAGCGWDSPRPKGYHGPRHTFPVRITDPTHPITAGLPESFLATDELYHDTTVIPEARVLARAHSATERGGTGKDEAMLIVTEFGQGRGFTTVLGHEIAAMWEPGFRVTFLRGVEWAATGKVTLPPDAGWPKPSSPETTLRTLVVTGGHDYDPDFYTIFQDRPGFTWRHALSNQEAFATDLRKSVDVLVLYDFSQKLDDAGRARLQAFAESGKGIVVLHHAIADYQSWEWWWKEVVGGRYVLQSEPGYPGSDYKHDQWMEIVPAMNHPIVRDIGPMRFLDETYRGVWISSDAKPLLRTSQATSDPVVGWISPWTKSRVVYLQPGHDHHTHRHPAYRNLVRNAILWAGGRI